MLSYSEKVSTALTHLLPFAIKFEAIRIFNNLVQVTYWTKKGRCSTFLSKKAFQGRATDEVLLVGSIVKINSQRHGDFFYQLPGLITANCSFGAVVEVMGMKRWFHNDELLLVRPAP